MVVRTLRSYALLSVTIVLSFSLLLGYLVWTDSNLYNTYKGLFGQDRNIVTVYDQALKNSALVQALKQKATDYGDTSWMQFERASFWSIRNMTSSLFLENGKRMELIPVQAVSVPRQAWSIYANSGKALEIVWLDGKEHTNCDLKSGEILLDDRLYALFNLAEKQNQFDLYMGGYWDESGQIAKQPFVGQFTVVGVIVSGEPLTIVESKDDPNALSFSSEVWPEVALSVEDFNKSDYPDFPWSEPLLVFYTAVPESVCRLFNSLGITSNYYATYEEQNNALMHIRTEVGLKAVITAALLLILGINLYSCFSNALNDRRFEIGVKRAIGASKWSIIRQFLYESLLVMGANILVSVWLVMLVALTYKVIYEHLSNASGADRVFTLILQPYSIGMFAACSLTLTVVFSLIFAYQATQVQIVDYLKAE